VTLLTTHDMMEANELGDRIGVMSKGRLKCIGSPQFLKHRFGAGYDLTIAPQGAHDGGGSACDVDAVQSLISRFVPTMQAKNQVPGSGGPGQGADLCYQLPFGHEAQFASMFRELDANLGVMGVQSYGCAVTTLEQVFLTITKEDEAELSDEQKATAALTFALAPRLANRMHGGRDLKQQLRAMLRKVSAQFPNRCVAIAKCCTVG
jgi:hypothetical protein